MRRPASACTSSLWRCCKPPARRSSPALMLQLRSAALPDLVFGACGDTCRPTMVLWRSQTAGALSVRGPAEAHSSAQAVASLTTSASSPRGAPARTRATPLCRAYAVGWAPGCIVVAARAAAVPWASHNTARHRPGRCTPTLCSLPLTSRFVVVARLRVEDVRSGTACHSPLHTSYLCRSDSRDSLSCPVACLVL